MRQPKAFLLTLAVFFISAGYSQTSCPPNIDFEEGDFNHWRCYIGATYVGNFVNGIQLDSGGQRQNRHEIIDGFYQQKSVDQYGKFPVICPNGSGYSVKLGNDNVGAEAERIIYSFSIPSNRTDYSLTYYYAVVFQDPGHKEYEQPRFTARVYYDTTDSIIGCATYEYIATSNLPGFNKAKTGDNVWYKEWTPVTIDLSGFAGKSVRLEFTTADCTLGGHFGYAYIDVNSGCTTPVTGWAYCTGATNMELHAPFGYQRYEWWNSDFSKKVGDSITLLMTPPPPDGANIYLDLIPFQGFGCRDTVQTIIKAETTPGAPLATDTNYCQFQKPFPLKANTISAYKALWYTSPRGNDQLHFGALPQTDTAGLTNYYVSQISPGGCEGPRAEVSVKVFTTPIASLFINDAEQCINNNKFSFINKTANIDSTTKYLWDVNDGKTYTDTIPPQIVYQKSGNYKIKLSAVNNNICYGRDSSMAIVYAVPTPGFSINDSSQCLLTNNFYFNNTTNSNNFFFDSYWDFGDGDISSGTNGNHRYNKTGSYNVKLIASNKGGCKDSISKVVQVHPEPNVSFTVNSLRQCLDSNLFVFTNFSTTPEGAVKYLWKFGDGATSADTNASYHYTQYNNYKAELVASSDNGCSSNSSADIIVPPNPVINMNLSHKPDLCVGDILIFNASINPVWGNITSTQWKYNNGDIAGQNNNVFTTDSAGVYNLFIENSEGCSALSSNYNVTVNPYPTGTVHSNLDYVCETKMQEIQATGGNTYRWFRNGTEIKPDSLSSYFATHAGTYKVALVSAVGCTTYLGDSITLSFVSKPQPDFLFSNQCAYRKIDFTDKSITTNSGDVNYLWDFGDGYNSTLRNPFHTFFAGNHTFPVSLTVSAVKCPNVPVIITKNTFIEQPLKPMRYKNVEVAAQKPITLLPRNAGMDYAWKPSLWLSNPSVMKPVFKGQKDLDYVVTITTKNGCIINDSVQVKVYNKEEIFVPTAFTPNHDGLNEFLKPVTPSIETIRYFRIYNLLGQLVFESVDKTGWDGNYAGKAQPSGTYVWEISAVDFDDNVINRKGYVVLIR
jgi:gliding motility-associated-like protein